MSLRVLLGNEVSSQASDSSLILKSDGFFYCLHYLSTFQIDETLILSGLAKKILFTQNVRVCTCLEGPVYQYWNDETRPVLSLDALSFESVIKIHAYIEIESPDPQETVDECDRREKNQAKLVKDCVIGTRTEDLYRCSQGLRVS